MKNDINRILSKEFGHEIELIIFDVDGTLYDEKKMRFFMLVELLLYYFWRPLKWSELKILWHFRKEREKRAKIHGENVNISVNQYIWCQQKVGYSIEKIEACIQKWIHQKPLKYLAFCVFKTTRNLITQIKKQGIKTAVYSDYTAVDKLEKLNITVDLVCSSEQKEINVLKPSPQGLEYIAKEMKIAKQHILFVGNRLDHDGSCAKSAGVNYMDIKKFNALV